MQKFNPIITILTGVIITITLIYLGFAIINASNEFGMIGGLLLPVALIIGGFISTYFTEKKFIRYSIYEGLIVSLIFSIYLLIPMLNDTGLTYLHYIVTWSGLTILITLGACLGGISGSKHNLIIPIPPL